MLTPSIASHAFIEAAATLGAAHKYNDFNGASQEAGAGFYQSTRTPEGVRVTAGSAFVRPILGYPHFRLLTGVRARRVVVEHGRARGVEYDGEGGVQTLWAEREVILCGGAFETPKLMLLSGLGPAAHLAEHGVAVVCRSAGSRRQPAGPHAAGCRLRGHPNSGFRRDAGGGRAVRLDRRRVEGRLARPAVFLRSDRVVPDEYRTSGPGFTPAPILAQPKSVGTVRLASADPTANAVVDPQYLSRDEDLAVLEYGIRYARELVHTKPFDALRGRELAPGASVTGSAELRDYIRRVASTVWHPVGTCKMGPESDPAAVVDDRLRVRGIEALRIADASIMPKLVNGNPNAAIMMIAEKAADLIRGDQPAAAVVPPVPEFATTEQP